MISLLTSTLGKYIGIGIVLSGMALTIFFLNQSRISANLRADLAQQQLSVATEFNDTLKSTIEQIQKDSAESSAAITKEMQDMRSRMLSYDQIKKGLKDENGCVGPAVSTAINGLRGNKN